MKTTSGQDALTTRPAHTPGPWTYDTADGMSTPHPYAADGDTAIYADKLGVAVTCSYLRKKEEQEANARLIAAAPDMLAALKEYVEWGAMTGSDRDLFDRKFKAAIAKAERGQ